MLRQPLPCCGAADDCDGAAVVAAATDAAAAAAAALPAVPTVAACAATFAAGCPFGEEQQVRHRQQRAGQQQQQEEAGQRQRHCHDQPQQHGAEDGHNEQSSERQQQENGQQPYPAWSSTCAGDLAWRPPDPQARETSLPAAGPEAPSTNVVGMTEARRAAAARGRPELQQKLLLVQDRQIAVLCLRFSDRYFLTVSDNGKMSALLQGSTGFEEARADIDVSFLFGDRRREHYLVYARALLSLIRRRSTKQQVNLLLAISVQDESPAFFKQVMQGIEEHFRFV